MRQHAPFHDPRNAFHWEGQPSIFTTGNTRNPTVKQLIDNALRHNHESTLGYQAGHTFRATRGKDEKVQ